jgi:hypothetical protein
MDTLLVLRMSKLPVYRLVTLYMYLDHVQKVVSIHVCLKRMVLQLIHCIYVLTKK